MQRNKDGLADIYANHIQHYCLRCIAGPQKVPGLHPVDRHL